MSTIVRKIKETHANRFIYIRNDEKGVNLVLDRLTRHIVKPTMKWSGELEKIDLRTYETFRSGVDDAMRDVMRDYFCDDVIQIILSYRALEVGDFANICALDGFDRVRGVDMFDEIINSESFCQADRKQVDAVVSGFAEHILNKIIRGEANWLDLVLKNFPFFDFNYFIACMNSYITLLRPGVGKEYHIQKIAEVFNIIFRKSRGNSNLRQYFVRMFLEKYLSDECASIILSYRGLVAEEVLVLAYYYDDLLDEIDPITGIAICEEIFLSNVVTHEYYYHWLKRYHLYVLTKIIRKDPTWSHAFVQNYKYISFRSFRDAVTNFSHTLRPKVEPSHHIRIYSKLIKTLLIRAGTNIEIREKLIADAMSYDIHLVMLFIHELNNDKELMWVIHKYAVAKLQSKLSCFECGNTLIQHLDLKVIRKLKISVACNKVIERYWDDDKLAERGPDRDTLLIKCPFDDTSMLVSAEYKNVCQGRFCSFTPMITNEKYEKLINDAIQHQMRNYFCYDIVSIIIKYIESPSVKKYINWNKHYNEPITVTRFKRVVDQPELE